MALALSTPIPTEAGWTTIGTLKVGNQVIDDAGAPCSVTDITGEMTDHPCYEVIFDDGARIIADAGHLWLTEQRCLSGRPGDATRGIPKSQWGLWRLGLRNTDQIAATLRYRNGNFMSANHSVALCGRLDLPERDLPIPPCTLGAWLGDGDSDSARLTVAVADWEIVDRIAADGEPVIEQMQHAPHIARVSLSRGKGGQISSIAISVLAGGLAESTVTAPDLVASTGHDPDRINKFLSSSGYFDRVQRLRGCGDGGGTFPAIWRLRDVRRAEAQTIVAVRAPMVIRLRSAGLLGNKHVPRAYLRASAAQRVALLQGLMDTDGTISSTGQCEFTTTTEMLADGVAELARSLGIKAFIRPGRATLRGLDIGRKWRVTFNAPPDLPVFQLRRKLERQVKRHDRRCLSHQRCIVEFRRIEPAPVKCISVNSSSRMYLAGREMIPTHDSPVSAAIGLNCLLADDDLRA